jgi:hypothetical protein
VTVVETIAQRLRSDATLVGTLSGESYTGILKGGVWTRRLKREPPGDTPAAFYQSDKGRMIKPSAVVLDGGERRHEAEGAIHGAYRQTVRIFLYAPATASGKQAIHDAADIIWSLVSFLPSGWAIPLPNGNSGFASLLSRTGIAESEQFSEAVFDVLSFEIVGRRPSPEV